MTSKALVSTIIATTALAERVELLKRAIFSVRSSSVDPINIIVVVNGNSFDPAAYKWLKQQPDIKLEYIKKASLPFALAEGRKKVTTPYFSTLDDDDEYLPHATDMKLATIKKTTKADLVISNGFFIRGNKELFFYENLSEIPENMLLSIFQKPWLNSCNALYKSDSISQKYFENYHEFAEWTWLAFKIALDNKKICILNSPTFRVHNTQNSLSKSDKYMYTYIHLYRRMLTENPPKYIKNVIHKRMGAYWHHQSNISLKNGNYYSALIYHLRSLCMPGRLRYFMYTRHILAAFVKH